MRFPDSTDFSMEDKLFHFLANMYLCDSFKKN